VLSGIIHHYEDLHGAGAVKCLSRLRNDFLAWLFDNSPFPPLVD